MTQPTPIPDPIGAVHYQLPRAVMVRDSEDLRNTSHSAVSSPLFIYTETKAQADALISKWDEIMTSVSNHVNVIFEQISEPSEPG